MQRSKEALRGHGQEGPKLVAPMSSRDPRGAPEPGLCLHGGVN